MPRRRRHARHRQQTLGHDIVGKPAQLLHRHIVGSDREIDDFITRGRNLEHPRFEDAIGQVATNLVDRRLDLVHRDIDVFADVELNTGLRTAFAGGAGHNVHALDRGHRAFDLLGNLSVELARCRAGLRDHHDHDGKFDVRIVLHAHARKAEETREQQPGKKDQRNDRVADRPGRDVTQVHAESIARACRVAALLCPLD